MSALLPEQFVAVTPTLVRWFGPSKAMVLQHLHFRSLSKYAGGVGSSRMSQAEIAEDTGLSESSVYRALKDLLRDQIIGKHYEIDPEDGLRKGTYAIDYDRIPEAGSRPKPSDRESKPKPSDREGPSRDVTGSDSSIDQEEGTTEEPPPTPSTEGDEGPAPELFDDPEPTPDLGAHRKRIKAAAKQASSMVVAAAELFWKDWPSGKGRGGHATFLDAWCKRIGKGVDRHGKPVTVSIYRERLDHYREARVLYRQHWLDRGEDVHAPMLNGSTFVNSKSHLWAERWTIEDVASYWRAPRGRDWDEAPSESGAVVGSSMFDALDQAIAAEGSA